MPAVIQVDGERLTPVSERPSMADRATDGAGPGHGSSHDSLVSAGSSSRQNSRVSISPPDLSSS